MRGLDSIREVIHAEDTIAALLTKCGTTMSTLWADECESFPPLVKMRQTIRDMVIDFCNEKAVGFLDWSDAHTTEFED